MQFQIPVINLSTLIIGCLSAVINFVLIFLLLKQRRGRKANIFLAGWIFLLTFSVQIVGPLAIIIRDPEIVLLTYQIGMTITGLMSFFYLFVREYLEIKKEKKIVYFVFFHIALIILVSLVKRDFFIKGVEWSEEVQFYIFKANYTNSTLLLPGFSLWFFGIYKLFRAFLKSHSPIKRNRLKYLILGGLFPLIGGALISLPVTFVHRFPADMFGVTFATICLTYGVLKYRLLDINVIIKKGLFYSFITFVVTSIYLLFSFSLRFLFQTPQTPFSLPTILSTALFIALVFQPLQRSTQTFLDKLFSRLEYDPQKLVANLSKTFSESFDLNILSKKLINILSETLQINKAALFLLKENTNTLEVQSQKNLPSDFKKNVINIDSPLLTLLSQSDQVRTKEDLKKQNILMA